MGCVLRGLLAAGLGVSGGNAWMQVQTECLAVQNLMAKTVKRRKDLDFSTGLGEV
jgi:hypothetical protein